ncbi:histidine kinase [Alkalihalobacillus sp. APA_J-10(15)]|nr:histidine kinase [Halalkalibacter sp. APA_J-10(15)]
MKAFDRLRNFFVSMSLKSRISILLGTGTFLLLAFTILFAYFSMSSILTSKLHSTFNSNVQQIRLSIENKIDDLNYVAQQIVFSDNITYNFYDYLHLPQSYERVTLYDEIKSELNLVTFSNPSIGLVFIYIEGDDDYFFNNYGVKDPFVIDSDTIISEGSSMYMFGPHVSMERYKDSYVLSTIRELNMGIDRNVYVYLESNLDLTNDLLAIDHVMNDAEYMILDDSDQIIYSDSDLFPKNQYFNREHSTYGKKNGYYWFQEQTDEGWSIIALIPISEYNQEMNQWVLLMIYIMILFVVISFLVSLILWKTIYKPINEFRREIKLVGNNNFHTDIVDTKIPEFSDLVTRFRAMRTKIAELIKEIEKKERKRADLEVEKLKHQISPHFLMNTLDTAKWLAISGERKELTHLLTSLNKLLYYNMGKLGILSTLEDELDSMEQYLKLQQIRYDFSYETNIQVSSEVLRTVIPRFILQPIVENSIYHGLVDEGTIRINVNRKDSRIIIEITDDGRGMEKEKMKEILYKETHKQTKSGMGIGLNYVKRVMDRTYGEYGMLEIQSTLGKGTTIRLSIPFIKGENP